MLPTQQESPSSSSEVSIKFGSYLVNENSPTPYSDATRFNHKMENWAFSCHRDSRGKRTNSH
ncbi:hypothetical protein G5I_04676 [Acromyrmex echinatior]|uniref:Uncharacterized protein n=1 Tax=Acromyrmex echinatior TaxID=103372 RepID=F4WGA2_ACREC|nr:hypothetical protein G5I_04676 [Acromyrmex echinatior]